MGRRQSSIFNDNKLKLGFFSPYCSSGMAVTKVLERWDNSWDNNIVLARLADEAGIESCCRSRAGSAMAARPTFDTKRTQLGRSTKILR